MPMIISAVVPATIPNAPFSIDGILACKKIVVYRYSPIKYELLWFFVIE